MVYSEVYIIVGINKNGDPTVSNVYKNKETASKQLGHSNNPNEWLFVRMMEEE